MEVIFDILRRRSEDAGPYRQKVRFSCDEDNLTVALALRRINSGGYTDEEGRPVEPIRFEEGCGQKKCGACAMLIAGKPRLACDTFLAEFRRSKYVTLEPLKKFPCVEDLLVDRSIMMENLKTLRLWAERSGEHDAHITEKEFDNAYDASLCLQCGCCLEACPNFYPGGRFFSAAAFAPQTRLISSLDDTEKADIKKLYRSHIYDGCGKALACEKVCPVHLPLDRLLSRSNAVKVWRRK